MMQKQKKTQSLITKQTLQGNDHILLKQLFLSCSLCYKSARCVSLRRMRFSVEMTCLHVPILATTYPSLNIFHSCSSISLSRRSLFFPVFLPSIPCSTSHSQSCFLQVRTCSCYALKLFSCREPGSEVKKETK